MAAHDELWKLDAVALAVLTRSGQVSAREATESHLRRLDAVNPKINAVVHQFPEEARDDADATDRRRQAGETLGALHGVPITIKITADQKGHPSDNGVVAFRNNIATEDSTVVTRLKQAGAVVIGRTNSPAFAMRFHTDNMLHGKTFNPRDRSVSAGGSSGGAGAATAVGIGAIGHGTDIGGSIRWPAFCNGLVGLRPTPGRVPMHSASGATDKPMAAQLMAVTGPLTRSVRDARLALEVMAGAHPSDPLAVDVALRGAVPGKPVRVALMSAPPGPPIHSASRDAVLRAGANLRAAGYEVCELDGAAFPAGINNAAELWNAIGMGEIRPMLEPLLPVIADPGLERSLRFWWDVAGPVDMAAYQAALRLRDTLIRKWQLFLEDYPLVVTPAFGAPQADAFGDARDRAGMEFLLREGRFLLALSVLGFPALAMPVGAHAGLPQGVQIFSRKFSEDLCLDAGEAIEAREGVRPAIDPQF